MKEFLIHSSALVAIIALLLIILSLFFTRYKVHRDLPDQSNPGGMNLREYEEIRIGDEKFLFTPTALEDARCRHIRYSEELQLSFWQRLRMLMHG